LLKALPELGADPLGGRLRHLPSLAFSHSDSTSRIDSHARTRHHHRPRLRGAGGELAARVRAYELDHKHRHGVLDATERKLANV
jgi:hypothetical protein